MMMIVCFVSSALYRKGLVYLDCPINDDDCMFCIFSSIQKGVGVLGLSY